MEQRQAVAHGHHQHQLPEAGAPDRRLPGRTAHERRCDRCHRQLSGGPSAGHSHQYRRRQHALHHAQGGPERLRLRPGSGRQLQRLRRAAHVGLAGLERLPPFVPEPHQCLQSWPSAGDGPRDLRDRVHHLRRGDRHERLLWRRIRHRQRGRVSRDGRHALPQLRQRNIIGHGDVGRQRLDLVVDEPGREHRRAASGPHAGHVTDLRRCGVRTERRGSSSRPPPTSAATTVDTVPLGGHRGDAVACPSSNGCYAIGTTATAPVLLAGAVGEAGGDDWAVVTPASTTFTSISSVACVHSRPLASSESRRASTGPRPRPASFNWTEIQPPWPPTRAGPPPSPSKGHHPL